MHTAVIADLGLRRRDSDATRRVRTRAAHAIRWHSSAGTGTVNCTYGRSAVLTPIMERTSMSTSHEVPPRPSFTELFTPKLVTVLREGYGAAAACAPTRSPGSPSRSSRCRCRWRSRSPRASPAQGLYTAIFGGFLRLRARRQPLPDRRSRRRVHRARRGHGAGARDRRACCSPRCSRALMLAAIGLLRLGTYVKFIPYPVTVGFTAGIAVIIFASQLEGPARAARSRQAEPGPLLEKLPALWAVTADAHAGRDRAVARDDRRHRRAEEVAAALAAAC